jgi:hypothetical protein
VPGFILKGTLMEDCKVNHGFWDLPPEERAAIKDAACRRNDYVDFYDLPPEERDRAYSEAEK